MPRIKSFNVPPKILMGKSLIQYLEHRGTLQFSTAAAEGFTAVFYGGRILPRTELKKVP